MVQGGVSVGDGVMGDWITEGPNERIERMEEARKRLSINRANEIANRLFPVEEETGYMTCPECDGRGFVTRCLVCEGDGYVRTRDEEEDEGA